VTGAVDEPALVGTSQLLLALTDDPHPAI